MHHDHGGAEHLHVIDTDTSISSTSQADPTATLNLGAAYGFCVIGFHSGQNAPTGITPLAGWTARYEYDYTSQTAGIYTYDTIAIADVTTGWTQTADDTLGFSIAIGMGSFLYYATEQVVTVSESATAEISTPLDIDVSESITLGEYASAMFPRVIAVSDSITVGCGKGLKT